jgi:hypothetical protein
MAVRLQKGLPLTIQRKLLATSLWTSRAAAERTTSCLLSGLRALTVAPSRGVRLSTTALRVNSPVPRYRMARRSPTRLTFPSTINMPHLHQRTKTATPTPSTAPLIPPRPSSPSVGASPSTPRPLLASRTSYFSTASLGRGLATVVGTAATLVGNAGDVKDRAKAAVDTYKDRDREEGQGRFGVRSTVGGWLGRGKPAGKPLSFTSDDRAQEHMTEENGSILNVQRRRTCMTGSSSSQAGRSRRPSTTRALSARRTCSRSAKGSRTIQVSKCVCCSRGYLPSAT